MQWAGGVHHFYPGDKRLVNLAFYGRESCFSAAKVQLIKVLGFGRVLLRFLGTGVKAAGLFLTIDHFRSQCGSHRFHQPKR